MSEFKSELDLIILKNERKAIKASHSTSTIKHPFIPLHADPKLPDTDQVVTRADEPCVGPNGRSRAHSEELMITFGYVYLDGHKELVLVEERADRFEVVSEESGSILHSIPLRQIQKVIFSKKNHFLVRFHFRQSQRHRRQLLLELPNRAWLQTRLVDRRLDSLIMHRRSLDAEGKDAFQNSSLDVLPSSQQRGILELFVDEWFADWKVHFVALSQGFLYVLPLQERVALGPRASSGRFYKLVSCNLVGDPDLRRICREHVFLVKIQNEDEDLLFSAVSKQEKNKWILSFLN